MESVREECPYGCLKYRKSIEDVVEAGNKHKDKAIALKVIADEQKLKISSLREVKNSLLDQVDQLEFRGRNSSDLIIRMTRESREMKIQIRDLKKEDLEKEEIISEQKRKLDDVEKYKNKLKDLKDEISEKDKEIFDLREVSERFEKPTNPTSLKEELGNVAKNEDDDKCKSLIKQIEILQAKLDKFKEKEVLEKQKRKCLMKKMDNLADERKCSIEQLKNKMKKIEQKRIPACWFGINCRRMFCNFDHRSLFSLVNKRQKHEEVSHTFQSLCDRCGEIFLSLEEFNEHNLKGHGDSSQGTHRCRECSLAFKTRSDLNSHVIQDHSETEIEFEQCGKFFVSRKELRDHRKDHNNDKSETEKLNNMLEVLLNDKKDCSQKMQASENQVSNSAFKCIVCNEEFLAKVNLRKHKQRFHQMNKSKEKEPLENFQQIYPNRKQECNLCQLKFESIESMDVHMDDFHQGRWKINDPDVVWEGESYDESISESSESEFENSSGSENSEAQSGED